MKNKTHNNSTYCKSGIQRIHMLNNCTSVTVNGNGNTSSSSLTITFPAADEPRWQELTIINYSIYISTHCTKPGITSQFESIQIIMNVGVKS